MHRVMIRLVQDLRACCKILQGFYQESRACTDLKEHAFAVRGDREQQGWFAPFHRPIGGTGGNQPCSLEAIERNEYCTSIDHFAWGQLVHLFGDAGACAFATKQIGRRENELVHVS